MFLKKTAKDPLFNTNNNITRITAVEKGWDRDSRCGFNNDLNALLQFSSKDADVEPKGQGYRVNANEIL